jgi:hypothetical protein
MRFSMLTALVISSVTTSALALPIDFSKADLQCWINRSESLFVFQNDQKVVYVPFMQDPVTLNMVDFKTFRCPLCYEFAGSTTEKSYEGSTRGVLQNNQWAATLTLKINGEQQTALHCAPPSSN